MRRLGATSRKRLRPTENTEFSFGENQILHSTPIPNESASKRTTLRNESYDENTVVINAPSGFPYFTAILQQHGFIVSKPRNHIQVDQLVFRKNLSDWIEAKSKGKGGVENEASKFVSAMQGYLRVKESFEHSMTPTMHPNEVFQGSLLYNLLSIPVLQPHILEILLPEITEMSCIARTQEQNDRLAAMLGQLKWLPNVAGTKSYTGLILRMLDSATNMAKITLIRSFPDIIPEISHPDVSGTLRNMLNTAESSIVPSILDCFAGLDITENEWNLIYESAAEQMINAPFQDLTAYFGFLTRNEDHDTLSRIISDLRSKLNGIRLGGYHAPNRAVHIVEFVEKVRFCISTNRHLVPTWLKDIRVDLSDNKDALTGLDLSMLMIFGETFEEGVAVLRTICLDEKLAIKLLDEILENNVTMVSQTYQTLTNVCDTFLRSKKDHKAYSTVQNILAKLMLKLSPLETQEITSNLISILVNGYQNCRNVVLKILSEVTLKDPNKLLMFAPHLMGVLDSFISLPTSQARELMYILATLAYIKDSTDSERFGAEFNILLRKYLTHSSTEIRCLGVMGSLATVKFLSTTPSLCDDKKIMELLNLVWSFVNREEDPCLLFFDELSDIVNQFPVSVRNEFSKLIMESFESVWTNSKSSDIVDKIKAKQNKENRLTLMQQFDALDGEEMDENSSPVMVFEARPLGMSPRVFPAHAKLFFKLAQTQTQKPYLFGPILMPDSELYYRKQNTIPNSSFTQRMILGNYLVLAINFLRETVSAMFENKLSDDNCVIAVCFRLKEIAFLQQVLWKNFRHFRALPLAYVTTSKTQGFRDGPSTSAEALKQAPKRNDKKTTKGKGKKKAGNMDDDDREEDTSDLNVSVQATQLIPYLRKIDPAVFGLLEVPFEFHRPVENMAEFYEEVRSGTEFDELQKKCVVLDEETLSLMLLELLQQSRDLNSPFKILEILHLVEWLALHLKEISKGFPELGQTSWKLIQCFQLVLSTLTYYFEQILQLKDEELKHSHCSWVLSGFISTEVRDGMESEEQKIQYASAFLKDLASCVGNPATAMEHLKTMSSFQDLFPDNEDVQAVLVDLAAGYLKSDWKLGSSQVELMLKTWIMKSPDPIGVLREVISSFILPECGGLGTCTPANFHTWYSVLFAILAQYVSKKGKRASSSGDGVEFWKTAVTMFKDLVFLTETHRDSLVLTAVLRHARVFLDAFTNNGTSVIPQIYQKSQQELQVFLKQLQSTTRKIQSICEHCKIQKNSRLSRNVPQMKRSLEAQVFRFREIVALKEVPEIFWMGSLRHRNLDGELTSSQPFNQAASPSPEDEDMEVEEEETPETDTESEEEFSFDS